MLILSLFLVLIFLKLSQNFLAFFRILTPITQPNFKKSYFGCANHHPKGENRGTIVRMVFHALYKLKFINKIKKAPSIEDAINYFQFLTH